ncbi:MAG: sirohydrochlorin cobaltochelatase [Eggerthellaceae bacterium]|nr:sirohydrochlorin cobaltochelatase [Eggerthellaceae bacterium]
MKLVKSVAAIAVAACLAVVCAGCASSGSASSASASASSASASAASSEASASASSEAASSSAASSEAASSEAASSEAASSSAASSEAASSSAAASDADQAAAAAVDELIAAIQVQERTDTTDADCKAAKAAWDALTDAQKELVEEGGYFADDTGDASKDDPLAAAPDKENEILVVSFGTSFNDNRVATIGAVEKAIQAANPDWAVRRAFTAQIIINHVAARDGEQINTVAQALDLAKESGVKNLIVAPTHLMHGAEYDELVAALKPYEADMKIVISEPLLGEVGADPSVINDDKKAVAEAVVAATVKDAGLDSIEAADADKVAFVFMGHGTSHEANVTYNQMQAQMNELGYKNVFIGTVEGEPEDTACDVVIGKVKDAGYTKVILRPLMVVAGDHANNDMADPEDPESWFSQFTASGAFESVDCQIKGLGEILAVQDLYVKHVADAMAQAQ